MNIEIRIDFEVNSYFLFIFKINIDTTIVTIQLNLLKSNINIAEKTL